MGEMYPPPQPGDDKPQYVGDVPGENPPPSPYPGPQQYQPQQPAGGSYPPQPTYPQWVPTPGAAPSQPLYPQQPPAGAYPSQPFYPQQPPYMGAAPSQPLYGQQPAGYAMLPGIGAGSPPTYVKTNLGEYWKNAKNGKRNLIILGVILVVLWSCGGISSAVGSSSGAPSSSGQTYSSSSGQTNGQSGGAPQPTATTAPTPVPTESPAQYKASAKQVAVSDIAKDPNAYKGKTITFTAVIANFVQDSSGNTAGANVLDPNDYSSVVQIAFTPGFSLAHVNKADTITVWGQGLGSFTGVNGFGATITEGGIQEVYLHDSTTGYSDTSVTDPSSFTANS